MFDKQLRAFEESEKKVCGTCGSRMIARMTNTVLTSNPLQYPWEWWCGCGCRVPGGVLSENLLDDPDRKRWRSMNTKHNYYIS